MKHIIEQMRRKGKPLDVQLIALKQAGFKATIIDVVNINRELDRKK